MLPRSQRVRTPRTRRITQQKEYLDQHKNIADLIRRAYAASITTMADQFGPAWRRWAAFSSCHCAFGRRVRAFVARQARPRAASIAPSSQMLCLRVSGITKTAMRNMIAGTTMGYVNA